MPDDDPAGRPRLAAARRDETLEEQAYNSVRDAIVSGELRPGQRFSINETAKQLGVSRLPVIHAMRRLASEGFLVLPPHRGAMVTKPTAEEMRGRHLIAATLESLAAQEAIGRLDDATLDELRARHAAFERAVLGGDPEADIRADLAFHSLVWEAAGIDQLRDMLQTLWDQGNFYRSLVVSKRSFGEERVREHARMLRALELRDPEAYANAARDHRTNALEHVLEVTSERSADDPARRDAG